MNSMNRKKRKLLAGLLSILLVTVVSMRVFLIGAACEDEFRRVKSLENNLAWLASHAKIDGDDSIPLERFASIKGALKKDYPGLLYPNPQLLKWELLGWCFLIAVAYTFVLPRIEGTE